MDWSGLSKDISVGICTGLFAAYTYDVLSAMRKKNALAARFAPLAGTYEEFVRNERGLEATAGTVKLRYIGDKRFVTSATNAQGTEHWTGELEFGNPSGIIGEGYYSYRGPDDVGTHSVIYQSTLMQFDVTGSNLSHPKGLQNYKMVWKRMTSPN